MLFSPSREKGCLMAMKECPECGKAFSARRNDAVYCSDACRQRAKRKKDRSSRRTSTTPSGLSPSTGPGEFLPPIPPESYDAVSSAIDEARRVSNRFGQLANTAPTPCRAGCARIGGAIAGAIDREGW